MLTNKLLYDNILQKYQEEDNNVLESRENETPKPTRCNKCSPKNRKCLHRKVRKILNKLKAFEKQKMSQVQKQHTQKPLILGLTLMK